MGFSSSVNVVVAELNAFAIPYVLDAIDADTGRVYEGSTIIAAVNAYFFVVQDQVSVPGRV